MRHLIFVLVLFAINTSYSQEQTTKRIKITELMLLRGISNIGLFDALKVSDFGKLTPINQELMNNLENAYSPWTYNQSTVNTFSAMIGLQFLDKKKAGYKKNPLLRLGINYTSGIRFENYFSKAETTATDTFISVNTGKKLFYDSLKTSLYSFDYYSEQIGIDGSVLFRSNPKARWSVYAGIGINFNFSFNAKTSIYSTSFDWINTRIEGGIVPNRTFQLLNQAENEIQSNRNQTNYSGIAYIPLGVDFRIGRNNPFWKRAHLFYEIRPGINMTSIPELGTTTNSFIQLGFGVRATLD